MRRFGIGVLYGSEPTFWARLPAIFSSRSFRLTGMTVVLKLS